jgi:hypothetical protein
MKDMDDLDIKTELKEISNKIDSIIQKVKDMEPEWSVGINEDDHSQTQLVDLNSSSGKTKILQ